MTPLHYPWDKPARGTLRRSPRTTDQREDMKTTRFLTDDPTAPGWRQFARRRWPLLLLAIAVVAIAIWLFSRRGDAAEEAAAEEATEVAQGDSAITLDSAAQRLAGVELLVVTPTSAGALVANGTITYDANRVAVLSPRAEGRVVAVRADLGQQVGPGAVLALIESPDVGEIRGDLARARASLESARRNYEREQRLFAEQISPQKELLEAEAAFRSAEADFNSATARLRALGAGAGEGGTYGLATPIGGTVVERNVSPGQNVGPVTTLFTVADLRRVWITVDVYESDLARVHPGAAAAVVPSALPSESFTGRVTYAGGVVDTASRTFKVRVELSNSELRLRPGMFAQVRIQAPPGDTSRAGPGPVGIPEVAVQELDGNPVVFVATATPGRFVVRRVTLGPRAGGGSVVVTSGLSAGERIVTKGAFQLRAELTKASFGEES